MTDLFLSSARDDDEAFTAALYRDLTEAGFLVWWDQTHMPIRALTIFDEIRVAIHESERTVVVIGPMAPTSDFVHAEWQAALGTHKIVVPVLRIPPGTAEDP